MTGLAAYLRAFFRTAPVLLAVPIQAAPTCADLPPGLHALLGSTVTNVTTLPVDGLDPHLVFAAWQSWSRDGNTPVSHLELLRVHDHRLTTIWSRRDVDGMEPTLTHLYGDVPKGYEGVFLHLQRGADSAYGVIIVVDRRDRVRVIGRVDANGVFLIPWTSPIILVQTYSAGDPFDCVAWVGSPGSLVKHACPAVDTY